MNSPVKTNKTNKENTFESPNKKSVKEYPQRSLQINLIPSFPR